MKTTKQRKKERKIGRFGTHFHSAERVEWFRQLPCEVTGWCGYPHGSHNAHTRGGGMGLRASYESIVPMHRIVHADFDEMPEKKFKAKYNRTKRSVRDKAKHYHRLWLEHVGEDA